MWYVWLIAAGIFFVAEIMTTGFLIFWLAIGALLAMIVSFITESILIQTIVFVITSIILIFLTKPLINKYISKSDAPSTNSYSLLGKHGIVTIAIEPLKAVGQVKVNGEVWSAKSDNNEIIPENSEIEVLKIDGVKLIVKPVKVPSIN